MTKQPAIELKNITKRFGKVVANKNVSLTAYHGEILSILGENGSGKTTLMNMISGIYFPDEGSISVNGEQVVIASPKDAFNYRIGMIHQHFKLVDVFSAAENIVLGIEDGKYNLKKSTEEITQISAQYGFELDTEKKVYTMSVSEKQTVEIIKVLYRGADILILDEPTAVLTPQETTKLFDILRRMRDDGKCIIIITHKLHEVLSLSDRVAVLRKGEYVGTVNTSETSESELTEMMVGKKIELNINRTDVKDATDRLEVKNLTCTDRQGSVVLDNVSFTAKGGEILGIAGIAGSGQRELLEAIAGLQHINEGEIYYHNPVQPKVENNYGEEKTKELQSLYNKFCKKFKLEYLVNKIGKWFFNIVGVFGILGAAILIALKAVSGEFGNADVVVPLFLLLGSVLSFVWSSVNKSNEIKIKECIDRLNYSSCNRAVQHESSVGMLILYLFFNPVSFFIYLSNFIYVKNNREDFEIVRELKLKPDRSIIKEQKPVENLRDLTPMQIRELGVRLSFVPEDRLGMGLVGNMDIVDNMMLRSYSKGRGVFLKRKDPKDLAQKIISDLEVVTPGATTPVRRLSGGNVQKVLVGREIASSPKVLMVAYPVRGLDINSSYLIYNLLNEQKEKGVCIIFVGEDLDVLLELCDRIMVIGSGRITGMVDGRTATKEEIGLLMTKSKKEGKE